MEYRPPTSNLTRGLIGAALGSGLSWIVIFCWFLIYAILHGNRFDFSNIFSITLNDVLSGCLNSIIPVVLFGACLGFACGYPNGKSPIGWTAIYLFAASIFGFSILGSCFMPFRPRGSDPGLLSIEVLLASVCLIVPTALIVRFRIRLHVKEQEARERMGLEPLRNPADEDE